MKALVQATAVINTLDVTKLSASVQQEEIKPMNQLELTAEEQSVLLLAKTTADEPVAAIVAAEPDKSDDDEDDEDEKKSKAKAKAKAKAAKEKEDEDEACDMESKGSRADAVRIVNICALAGMPNLASEFLAADYSIQEVEKALLKHRAGKSKEVKISSGATTKITDFRITAAEMLAKKDQADAYRKYLVAHANEYISVMSNREFGENYKLAPQRSF
jgi:hypothetical protein